MAVTSVKLKHAGQGGIDKDGRKTTVVYEVVVDSETDDSNVVCAASGLPKIGALLASDKKQSLNSKTASLVEPQDFVWLVRCEYSTPEGTNGGGEKDDVEDAEYTQPWDLPPYNISYGTIAYQKVAEKAYLLTDDQDSPSTPVINAAGDPFDPPLMTTRFTSLISFSYNLEDFDEEWVTKYIDTINRNQIKVLGVDIKPYYGRINSIQATEVKTTDSNDLDITYWQVDVQIEKDNDLITESILNAGFNQLDAGGTVKTKITITDDDGNKAYPTTPLPLASDGQLLAVGGTPVYLEFQTKFAIDWTTLSMPEDREVVLKDDE